MRQHTKRNITGRKCFSCNREATEITIDDEGEMFYLCEKHLKLFIASNPKGGIKKNKDDEY